MAVYKIFPEKDATMYSGFPLKNTGIDEILEISTFLDTTNPEVSRALVKFSQTEIENVVLNFMTQHYPMLYPTDLITYHYAWWRPGKFKQLRYDQLNRSQEYWDDFEKGVQEIIQSKNIQKD